MAEIVTLKPAGDYSEHTIIKEIDGEKIKLVNIDAMTEEQFKKYCRDTGSEWFQRMTISV